MRRYPIFFLISIVLVATLHSTANAQSLVIENFNEYTNNTTLADLNDSPADPWIEFGTANNGYLTSKTDAAHEVNGSPSASAPATWGASGSQTLTIRYDFTYSGHIGVQNFALAAYTTANVNVRSNATGTTTAGLQLTFTDGNSAYTSTVITPLTGAIQAISFPLGSTNFTRASGTESFSTVFSQISAIGFLASNTSSAPSVLTESLLFDDFSVTAAPEPGSVVLLGCGAMGLFLKRRRRRIERFAKITC